MNEEIDGEDVLRWLTDAHHDDAQRLLVGCLIDDGRCEDLLEIRDVDFSASVFACGLKGTARRFAFASLKDGYVIDPRSDRPLKQAVDAAASPFLLTLKEADRSLYKAGINASKVSNADDKLLLVEAWRDHELNHLPSLDKRQAIYECLKAYGLDRLGISLTRSWLKQTEQAGSPPDLGTRIKLASFLRRVGDLDDAMSVSAVVDHCRSPLSQRAYLALVRAGCCMDLFELRHDEELLEMTERYAKLAWAHNQSDEVRSVFGRLDALRSKLTG